MKLSDYRFYLPPELIAIYPNTSREKCKLMVLHRKTGEIEHRMFFDIKEYFKDGDLLVRNDTKVFPARLYGVKEKTGAKIEVFLLRELNPEIGLWDVVVEPARKIRIGNKIFFGENNILMAEVIDNTTSRGRTIRFLYDGPHDEFIKLIKSLGEPPIPREIRLKRNVTEDDYLYYQTIYAKNEGSVVAPHAGLHFSRELLKRLEIVGVDFADLTLHIGLGVYKKVDVEDLSKHKMDSEEYVIPEEVVDKINKTKENKKRVFITGISVMRALESSITTTGILKPSAGWTNKFIYSPYTFTIPDALITTFHYPESTSLMATSAFAGHDFLMEAYKIAIAEKYRFFAYGDMMLIL